MSLKKEIFAHPLARQPDSLGLSLVLPSFPRPRFLINRIVAAMSPVTIDAASRTGTCSTLGIPKVWPSPPRAGGVKTTTSSRTLEGDLSPLDGRYAPHKPARHIDTAHVTHPKAF